MPRGVYDRTKRKTKVLPSYGQNGDTEKAGRVKWTAGELKLLAEQWVIERMENPFEHSGALFEKTQRKVLDGSRQRTISSVVYQQPLADAIRIAWRDFNEKPPVQVPVIQPEPKIITVEVPRKLTAEEMLATLDEPALEALLSAKRLQRESQYHQTLLALAASHGATNLPKINPFIPRLEIFDAGQKKHPRIAVIGASADDHEAILGEIKAAELPALVRFPDGDDAQTVSRCDFAIICRHADTKKGDATGDRAIGELGRNRVILLDGYQRGQVLQAIRNIISRQ